MSKYQLQTKTQWDMFLETLPDSYIIKEHLRSYRRGGLGESGACAHSISLVEKLSYEAVTLGMYPLASTFKQLNTKFKACVAGGVFRSLFYQEVPNDIDVYLLESYDNSIDILTKLRTSLGIEEKLKQFSFKNKEYNVTKYIAILDIEENSKIENPIKIQLMAFKHVLKDGTVIEPRTASAIVNSFDLIPVSIATQFELSADGIPEKYSSTFHPEIFQCLASKNFKFNTVASFTQKKTSPERFYKYITDYGFRIQDQETINLLSTYIKTNQDGVDCEYF